MSLYEDIKQAEVNITGNQETGIQAEFNFPENLELFKGHFPTTPILPGVAQIEMVRFVLETVFSQKMSIKTIKKTKFSYLVRPNTPVFLNVNILSFEPEDTGQISVRVTVHADDKVAGKLNLSFLIV